MKNINIIILTLLFAANVVAQNPVFIEPCVSFRYDTSKLVVKDVFSNSVYDTERYSFKSKEKQDSSFYLLIDPSASIFKTTQEEINQRVESSIKQLKTLKNDTIAILDIQRVELKEFIGTAVITKVKHSNNQKISFGLFMVSEGRLVSVMQIEQTKEDKLTSNSNHWNSINETLEGITILSDSSIQDAESKILSKYNISVDSLPLRNLYVYGIKEGDKMVRKETYDKDSVPFDVKPLPFHHTYRGKLIVSPNLEHTAKEIRIINDYGERIFKIEAGEELVFTSKDSKKGVLEKRGSLVLISELGNNVEIPFKFIYVNE